MGIFRGKQKGELNLLSADTAREGFAKRKRKKSNRPDRSINQIYQDRWGAFAKAISADIVREGFAKRKRKKSCRSDRSTKQIFKDRWGAVAKAISADIARKGFAKRQPLASTPKKGGVKGAQVDPPFSKPGQRRSTSARSTSARGSSSGPAGSTSAFNTAPL